MMGGMLNSGAGRAAFQAANQGASAIQANANSASAPGGPAAPAPPTTEELRMQVLLSLYQAKKCG